MDIAFCTIDSTSYDIDTFSNLELNKLENLRRALICKFCKGKGYYRKKSIDNKPACFGAYHEGFCDYSKPKDPHSRSDTETVEDVDRIMRNDNIIDINFSTSTHESGSNLVNAQCTNTHQPSTTSVTHGGNTSYRNTSRGLKSLLRMLMQTDTFSTSDVAINTGKYEHPFKAKNFFVNFDDITDQHLDKWRGYWGVISHADNELTWLNTANEQSVSIPIENFKEHFSKTLHISSGEDLAGASILVMGWLNLSKNGKKWYIKIENNDLSKIYIRLKKD